MQAVFVVDAETVSLYCSGMKPRIYEINGRRVKRSRYYQLRRAELGLCPCCKRSVPKGQTRRCYWCNERTKALRRARTKSGAWEQGKRGRPPIRTPDSVEEKV
jgi:hypothetical protein